MAAGARPLGRSQGTAFDPLRVAWQLLTNVKFAVVLIGVTGLVSLLGVMIPQVPGPMRNNAAARAAWLELRRDDFGFATDPMDSLNLFELFHSPWYNALWLVVIAAVAVCTVSRLRPTARSVHRPPLAVGDRYFERAHHRASFTHAGGVEALDALLRRRRYRVQRTAETAETTYLFAERFAWAQYATFLSHLALIMLLVGALLTRFAAFDRTLFIAEGTPAAPVFDAPGPGQIFVAMIDSYRGRDERGNVVDYHSDIEVRRGDRVIRCTTTVNDPCEAFGHRIHQAAFVDDIARLRISALNGQALFDGVLDFEGEATAAPLLRVSDASGARLFEAVLPQLGSETGRPGPEDDAAVSTLTFPQAPGAGETVTYAAAWNVVEGSLRLVLSGATLAPVVMRPGDERTVGGYRVAFVRGESVPVRRIADLPGAGGEGGATAQLLTDSNGQPYLLVLGVDGDESTVLRPNQPVRTSAGYSFTFGGRVEASGVSIRRDPGDTFIWLAVGMAVVGLATTFYVPRRRLWLKVTPARTWIAGQGERTRRLSRELRFLGAALGSPDALLPEDREAE